MATMSTARCDDCDREHTSAHVVDRGLCPRCQRLEDQRFTNDMTSVDPEPWRMSRRSMQDRLGVAGNEDV